MPPLAFATALAFAAALACAAARPGIAIAQPAPDADWLDAALESAAAMPRLHSLLVSHDGELLVEGYFNGQDAGRIANVKSVSKSLISALVGIAIERGYIDGVDEPIGDFFADELADEPAKQRITIGQLLSMRAGLETTSNRNYGAWVLSPNWVEFALAQPLEQSPGLQMRYSTGNTHLLSAILTKATGMDTLSFARDVLAEPLGFRLGPWPTDPQGIYFGGNDMEMTPRQMLSFGELYMNHGRRDGRQVVPADWVDASFEPRVESPREADRYYGYGWWIRDMAGYATRYAWGYGGQFVLLVPEIELVIVTTSSANPGSDRRAHTREIYRFVEDELIAPLSRLL